MPKANIKDNKKMNEWCLNLQEKMNKLSSMSEEHKVEFKNNEVCYSMATYGVEVCSTRFDESFLTSKEYKKLKNTLMRLRLCLEKRAMSKKALKR
jgi:hypothetical protein